MQLQTKSAPTDSLELPADDYITYPFELDMSHVGLGTLDEPSLLVMFGTYHSRSLTQGLPRHAGQIVDAGANTLYPAYFMTHLRVPPSRPLDNFALWSDVDIDVGIRRFGDTILDSAYRCRHRDDDDSLAITMRANSLFILDPAKFRNRERQPSAPATGAVRSLERLRVPPVAIQDATRVRTTGFGDVATDWLTGDCYRYRLEANRDTAPGHPLIFAKFSLLAELSERQFLRQLTRNRISGDMLEDVSLLERKVFYYGNAFAESELTLHSRGRLYACTESLWKENPKKQYLFRLVLETEIYHDGALLAASRAEKVIAVDVRHQARMQDARRLFTPLLNTTEMVQ